MSRDDPPQGIIGPWPPSPARLPDATAAPPPPPNEFHERQLALAAEQRRYGELAAELDREQAALGHAFARLQPAAVEAILDGRPLPQEAQELEERGRELLRRRQVLDGVMAGYGERVQALRDELEAARRAPILEEQAPLLTVLREHQRTVDAHLAALVEALPALLAAASRLEPTDRALAGFEREESSTYSFRRSKQVGDELRRRLDRLLPDEAAAPGQTNYTAAMVFGQQPGYAGS